MIRNYVLYVETDDDFSLEYQGELFTGNFTILFSDPIELLKMQVLGPYGVPVDTQTKCDEFLTARTKILKDPNKNYDSTGGNRGVQWTVVDAISNELNKLPKGLHSYVRDFVSKHSSLFYENQQLAMTKDLCDFFRKGLVAYLEEQQSKFKDKSNAKTKT